MHRCRVLTLNTGSIDIKVNSRTHGLISTGSIDIKVNSRTHSLISQPWPVLVHTVLHYHYRVTTANDFLPKFQI